MIRYFTDDLCNYLTELEEFSIDYNDHITNQGLQKLTKLTCLNMERCDKITTEGFVNCKELVNLRLSCMNTQDDTFMYVPKLEVVYVNGGSITSTTLLSLKNLREVGFNSVHMDCIDFDKLIHLKKVSFSHNSSIQDDQLIYLRNVHDILLYRCPHIHGQTFHHLHRVHRFSVYETPLETKYMGQFTRFTCATDIVVSRCYTLTDSYMKRLMDEIPVLRYLP